MEGTGKLLRMVFLKAVEGALAVELMGHFSLLKLGIWLVGNCADHWRVNHKLDWTDQVFCREVYDIIKGCNYVGANQTEIIWFKEKNRVLVMKGRVRRGQKRLVQSWDRVCVFEVGEGKLARMIECWSVDCIGRFCRCLINVLCWINERIWDRRVGTHEHSGP